ncbi:hypothetical protein G5T42_07805 [Microbacterium sp. 4R-513]|uniref:hypothetical protein n=1 Tax=Microbacterium sp. 4R-513 TaxID=2567934 RepID=UPI0013E1BEC9|nr:hypothetical protein [Microbacterium sp. 4R-513]QIG39398.1 hypothetical protein G5T42_07805 [Microbacterium sp. 4R-513]
MTVPLAELFNTSKGEPIELDGELVHLWVEVGPLPQSRFTIELSAGTDRPQALCIEARGGTLEVAGQRSTSIVLWTDTAPPVIDLDAVPTTAQAVVLRFWNAWRGTRDVMHTGMGNVGIRKVAPTANRLTLMCSNGWGPVNFQDLHVGMTWKTSATDAGMR